MKHRVADLEGALLDAAVAKAERKTIEMDSYGLLYAKKHFYSSKATCWAPSRFWEQGGPIIERERISLMYLGGRGWSANFVQHFDEGDQEDPHTGPTPLIAAMRAYVGSKFGEEVDL